MDRQKQRQVGRCTDRLTDRQTDKCTAGRTMIMDDAVKSFAA